MNRTGVTPMEIRRQTGFSLATAIFLITVMALLAGFLVSFAVSQQKSRALDLLGARAYQAARAGIEWAAYQSLRGAVTPPGPCSATTNLTFAGTMLAGFTTTVTCARTTHVESPNTITMDRIVATACNQPAAGACPNPAPTDANYVERQLQLTLGQP